MEKKPTMYNTEPPFSGFNYSIWDADADLSDIESSDGLSDDDYEFDWDGYRNDIVEGIVNYIDDVCPYINAQYDKGHGRGMDVEILPEFTIYLRMMRKKLVDFIADDCHDDFDNWYERTKQWSDFNGSEGVITSLLRFWFLQAHGDDWEMSMYYEVMENNHVWEHIQILSTPIEELDQYELEEVAKNVVDNVEPFGYLEILMQDAQKISEQWLGRFTWQEIIAEKWPMEVIKAHVPIIERVHNDKLVPMFYE